MEDPNRALPIGRLLRSLLGVALVTLSISTVATSSGERVLAALGWTVGLVLLYAMLHWIIASRLGHLNRWLGAVLALGPIVALFLLGGAPGQLGAMLFLGASLLLASVLADPGCEVMSIPGLLFGRRTHLVCLFFSPIDWVEERLSRKPVR
ncbi:MAG: hypothetical protein O7A09_01460 [Proteobacteria bacterium]|nr:hypothetical protein [Pseudomonadota bacterium]